MTRVLVTGANGFVGRFVTLSLARQRIDVITAERDPQKVKAPESVWLSADTPRDQMRAALTGVQAVVHLAALVHDMRGETSAAAYGAVNCEYPCRLAAAAADAGVERFVFVSSIKVNGDRTEPGKPFTELSTPMPDGAYGESKWRAEQQLVAIADARGLELRIVRPPLVYGPGVRANFRNLMRLVRRRLPLPFADVHNARSLIYVENLADALVWLALTPCRTPAVSTHLVSDGEDLSTPDLVRAIARALRVKPRLVSVPERALSFALSALGRQAIAERLLGSLQVQGRVELCGSAWRPPISVETGLERTGEWFAREP